MQEQHILSDNPARYPIAVHAVCSWPRIRHGFRCSVRRSEPTPCLLGWVTDSQVAALQLQSFFDLLACRRCANIGGTKGAGEERKKEARE